MKRKMTIARGLISLLILMALAGTAQAAEENPTVRVLQTSTSAQTLTIFMDTSSSLDGAVCKVSNQSAPVLQSGTVAEGDAMVKTTVLVDISTSIPTNMRDKVISAIDKLIEQKSPSDEYRLITFAEAETVLCDFTADRYDIGKAAGNIVFNGQSSMIYDAIYNTVPSSFSSSDVPTLYRTVVITDGVDLTNIGVTMEELFLRLQSERYPVDVLAVTAAAAETANKELSAITRISGGRYCTLDPNTDLSALGQALGVSSCSYLEVQVPEQLLDGSVRQVDLTIGGENLSLDVKFPATYTQPVPTETVLPIPTLEPTPESVDTPEPVATPEPVLEPEPGFFQQYGVIILGAVVVVVVVLVVVLRRKKGAAAPIVESSLSLEVDQNSSGQETVLLTDDAQYTIKISAPKRPGKEWVLGVTGDILIGRADHCQIQLEDGTVSREHCRIVLNGERLELIHTGTNRTLLNGEKVMDRVPLNSGDIMELGREQLRVDYIQKLDGTVVTPGSDSNTQSLF